MSPEYSTVHNDRTFDIINDKYFDKYKLFIKHNILRLSFQFFAYFYWV